MWCYCRVADLLTWLTRSLLLTPTLHFVDDFGAAETSHTAASGFESCQALGKTLGLKFKESKAQPPATVQTIQGVVNIQANQDEVVISPTPQRVKKMRVQLQGILLDDALTPTEASALAGKMQFVAQSLFGKGGQASLKTLCKRRAAGRPLPTAKVGLWVLAYVQPYTVVTLEARRRTLTPDTVPGQRGDDRLRRRLLRIARAEVQAQRPVPGTTRMGGLQPCDIRRRMGIRRAHAGYDVLRLRNRAVLVPATFLQ